MIFARVRASNFSSSATRDTAATTPVLAAAGGGGTGGGGTGGGGTGGGTGGGGTGGGGTGGGGTGGGGTGGPDVAAPGLSLSLARTADLASSRSRGLSLAATCSEACTFTAELTIDRRTARRFGLASAKRVVVGRATTSLAAGQKKTLRVKFSSKAKRKLARAKKVKVQVALRAVDSAGNATESKRTVTLKKLRRASGSAAAVEAAPVVLLQRRAARLRPARRGARPGRLSSNPQIAGPFAGGGPAGGAETRVSCLSS